MKTTIKPTLALRAHSIRNLSAAELRVAHGGSGCDDTGTNTCEAGTSGKKIAPHR
jgi:hypothetical protein